MSSVFLAQLGQWLTEKEEPFPDEHPSEILAKILELGQRFTENPELILEVQQQAIHQPNSVDLAKILQLLTHKDVAFQEQGLLLLEGTDSKEIWDAVMMGADITEDGVTHDSFHISGRLKTALLSNPFYDYSTIQNIDFRRPLPSNLEFLEKWGSLNALTIRLDENEYAELSDYSLYGLEDAPNVRTLTLLMTRYAQISFSEDQIQALKNIEVLVIVNSYSSEELSLSFVDHLPNLKELHIKDLALNYDGFAGLYQPKIYLSSRSRNGLEGFLPSEKKSFQIEEIDLSYDYGYDLDCRILGNCTVKKIMFSTRVSCKHVFALKDIDPSSFPALEGKAFEWHFTKQLPLKRLFADPGKIKRRLKTLQRELEKGCLRIGIAEQSAEFQYLNPTELHIVIKTYWRKYNNYTSIPERFPQMYPNIKKLCLIDGSWDPKQKKYQYGGTSLMTDFASLAAFSELEELELHSLRNLRTKAFVLFTQFPKLKKLKFVQSRWTISQRTVESKLNKIGYEFEFTEED